MEKRLQTAPFTIDADKIAQGLLDLFTDDERVVLRFGMLPAGKMEVLEKALRDKFLEYATSKFKEGDEFTAICETQGKRRFVDFSMKRLVSEAVHEVCLALYKIGDLVV